ncbi:MAG TPA: hypothetical protein DD490_22310 [Acidobacteria bacterium]|nr:hypothetical protein [Acidobacteriota bacterium]
MPLPPTLRTWIQRLVVGVLVLAALYPVAANLFLLPSIGPALINRRPERFRMGWSSAWSVWPGVVHFQGLELRGRQPRVHWWITAEAGEARIDLPALLRREVHVEALQARGVRSQTNRVPPPATPRPDGRKPPWTVRLEKIDLAAVREIGYGPLLLQGDGTASGSLRIVMRREAELGSSVVRIPAGRALLRGTEIARHVDLRAELRLGPYAPREHRGIAGFDFLSGHLEATGEAAALPIFDRIGPAEGAPSGAGRLAVDLRLEQGRLVPGSRVRFATPGGAQVALAGSVEEGRLVLAGEAAGITLRRRDGTPFLSMARARASAATPELRLSRLAAQARSLREQVLVGAIEAESLRFEAAGRKAAAEVSIDRGSARLDLVALLSRRVVLDDLVATGVTVQVDEATRPAPPREAGAASPWAIAIGPARIEQLREVRSGPYRLEGEGRIEGALTWDGDVLEMRETAVEMKRARVLNGNEVVARGVEAHLEGGLAPCAVRRIAGLAVLDCASLVVRAKAVVPRLRDLPAVGAGPARAELRIVRGALAPGSFFELGTTIATVEGGKEPRLAVEARNLVFGEVPGRRPLLRAAAARASVPAGDLHLGRFLAALQGEGLPPVADLETSGLQMNGVGERVAWTLGLDRAQGKIDLQSLARHEAALTQVRAVGARLEVRKSRPGEWLAGAAGTEAWRLRLVDAHVTGLREAILGTSRLVGNGRIEADLDATFGAERSCRLDRLLLGFDRARIESKGRPVARDITLLSDLRVAPFTPGELRGAGLFRLFSGTVAVEGEISSLGFLRPYLGKSPLLNLGGSGRLSADIRLEAGHLLPPTRLTIDPANLSVEYLLSRATGSATVQGMVIPGPGQPHFVLGVDFGRFAIAARDRPNAPAHVTGEKLHLSVTSADLDLAEPGKNVLARIVLPEAVVEDLAFYNSYLPPGTGVSIRQGQGKLSFDLTLEVATQTAYGEIDLSSDAVRVEVEDLDLSGSLHLHTRLKSSDLRKRRFILDGTRLALDRVEIRHVGPDAGPARSRRHHTAWFANVELEKGSMVWAEPLSLQSTIRLDMKEAGFLLEVLGRHKPYLVWFASRLRNTPVAARGELRLADGAIEVEPLQVLGGRFDILSRLRLTKERKHGQLYVRWKKLAVGVDLEGRERRYRLIKPLEWFRRQRLGG